MSDYLKTTEFGPKDLLATGDPAKKVRGTELDTEFDNIETAIATKYDSGDLGVVVQAYDANLDALSNSTIAFGSSAWTFTGSLVATAIQNTPIGSTTPSTGAFTTLTTTGTAGIGGKLTVTNANIRLSNAFFLTGNLVAGTEVSLIGRNASDQVVLDPDGYGLVSTSGAVTFTSTGINNTAIGATTPAAGSFTTLAATGAFTAGADIYRSANNSQLFISGGNAQTVGAWLGLYGGTHAFSPDTMLIGAAEMNIVNQANSEYMARFIQNGAASLYYDGAVKLETTSVGAAVTGAFSTTGNITAGNGTATVANFVNGPTSGTAAGAGFLAQNGGTTLAALGNYSVILGGAYNATPTLYFLTDLALVRAGSTVGSITSTGINSTAIGATTPSTGAFTTVSASGAISTQATAGFLTRSGATTSAVYASFANTGSTLNLGIESSTGGSIIVGGTAYASVLNSGGTPPVEIGVNNTKVASFSDTGLTETGFIKSSSATAGVGYATGAGGTVTQITSKATGVTLNKICGEIVTHNAALNNGANVAFSVSNSACAANDVVIVNGANVGAHTSGAYQIWADDIGNGGFFINIRNVSGGNLSEAITMNFVIIKAVAS